MDDAPPPQPLRALGWAILGLAAGAALFELTGLPVARLTGRLGLLLAASQGLWALWLIGTVAIGRRLGAPLRGVGLGLGPPLARWAWGETTVQIGSWPLGVWVDLGLLELPAGRALLLRGAGPLIVMGAIGAVDPAALPGPSALVSAAPFLGLGAALVSAEPFDWLAGLALIGPASLWTVLPAALGELARLAGRSWPSMGLWMALWATAWAIHWLLAFGQGLWGR